MRTLLALAILLLPSLAAAQSLDPDVTDLTLELFQDGLGGPTAMEFLPDGRLVIIEQPGTIKVRPAGGGALIDAGRLPVNAGGEQGLLGLAVDPIFSQSNRLYFYYSKQGTPEDDRHRVAYATINPETSLVDTANLVEIVDQLWGPANHNGGGISFGPDGYLYIGVGDTGCNCNCGPGSANNYLPTCLTNKAGKILRVDREGAVPQTNPLVGVSEVPSCTAAPRPCNLVRTQPNPGELRAPDPMIYNWGFRNPWRFGFDPRTGYLWIGDVGEVTFEEVTISTGPGQHHGWPFREGGGNEGGQDVSTCAASTPISGNCKEPAYYYNHSEAPAVGQGSVTGGVFTNHCSWPERYRGLYWFGEYNKARIWTLTPNAARDGVEAGSRRTIVLSVGATHFTTGPDGALYVGEVAGGAIWRIAPSSPIECEEPDAGVSFDLGVGPVVDGGPRDAGPDDEGEDGCSCRALDAGPGSLPLGLLLIGTLAALTRKRRERAATER